MSPQPRSANDSLPPPGARRGPKDPPESRPSRHGPAEALTSHSSLQDGATIMSCWFKTPTQAPKYLLRTTMCRYCARSWGHSGGLEARGGRTRAPPSRRNVLGETGPRGRGGRDPLRPEGQSWRYYEGASGAALSHPLAWHDHRVGSLDGHNTVDAGPP